MWKQKNNRVNKMTTLNLNTLRNYTTLYSLLCLHKSQQKDLVLRITMSLEVQL